MMLLCMLGLGVLVLFGLYLTNKITGAKKADASSKDAEVDYDAQALIKKVSSDEKAIKKMTKESTVVDDDEESSDDDEDADADEDEDTKKKK